MTRLATIARFNILIVLAALSSAFAFVPGRDDWYLSMCTYTDYPRIFQLGDGCPYEKFYLDCNECVCHRNDARPICTAKLCPEIPQIVNWSDGQECPAGRPFYWKCNDCICGHSGKNAICTRKFCPNFGIDE